MRLKDDSIQLLNLQPQILLGLFIVDQVMQRHGHEAIITCGSEGKHSYASLHYAGSAVDLRSNCFANKQQVFAECKTALGKSSDFDMILENKGDINEHWHLEWQPKYRQ